LHEYLILLFLVFLGILTYWIFSYIWKVQLSDKYTDFSIKKSFRIIGLTQIAKYLPGNIAHIFGRFYLAQKILSKRDIAYTMFIENAMFVISALLVGIMYFTYNDAKFIAIKSKLLFIGLIILFIFAIIIYSINHIRNNYVLIKIRYKVLFKVFSFYIILHVIGGITIFVLFKAFTPRHDIPILLCISGYSISFMIGLITPGAPGGIGVREFTFTKLLTPFASEIYALQVILLFRFISIISDILLFIICKYLMKGHEIETSS
jgi:hypothetical protein